MLRRLFVLSICIIIAFYSYSQTYVPIRIVESPSYSNDPDFDKMTKIDITKSVRRVMKSYAELGVLRDNRGNIEQFVIDDFKRLFTNNAKIITDYSDNLEMVNVSYYVSDIFNSEGDPLNYSFDTGVLKELSIDADDIYTAKVEIVKRIRSELNNGIVKNGKGQSLKLTILLDISKENLSNVHILEITGEKVSNKRKVSRSLSKGSFSIAPMLMMSSPLSFRGNLPNFNKGKGGGLKPGFNISLRYQFLPSKIGIRFSALSLNSIFSIEPVGARSKNQNEFISVNSDDLDVTSVKITQEYNADDYVEFSTNSNAMLLGPEFELIKSGIFNLSTYASFGISNNRLAINSSDPFEYTYTAKISFENGYELPISNESLEFENSECADLSCIGLGDQLIQFTFKEKKSINFSYSLGLNLKFKLTNNLSVNGLLGFYDFGGLSNFPVVVNQDFLIESFSDADILVDLESHIENFSGRFLVLGLGVAMEF